MATLIGLKTPFDNDAVEIPQLHYGEPLTAIYFLTDNHKYGRITFENLDSIKVSRGELLPFENGWKEGEPYCWVKIVKDSEWLKERYNYESKHYGDCYEFGGDVDEMLTDFNHYIFSFHDQFVEAIALGIWFEEHHKGFIGREHLDGHPLLPIPLQNMLKFVAHGINCQVRVNSANIGVLKNNSIYCSQKLMEFALEFKGEYSVSQQLILRNRNGKLLCILMDFFGKKIAIFDSIPTLDEVKPYIVSYMKDVVKRREDTERDKITQKSSA